MITFFVYAPMCNLIFSTFQCETLSSGAKYLRVDETLSCDTKTYEFYFNYAMVMVVVFPVGIPMLYFVALYRSRHMINPPTPPAMSDAEREKLIEKNTGLNEYLLSHLGFIYHHYSKEYWWFEVVDCFRRLIFTGIIKFVPRDVRALCGLTLTLSFQSLYREFSPYAKPKVAVLANLGHCILVFIFLVALALESGVVEKERKTGVGYVLSVFVCAFFSFAAYTQFYAALKWQGRAAQLGQIVKLLRDRRTFEESAVPAIWASPNTRAKLATAVLEAAVDCLHRVERNDDPDFHWDYLRRRLMRLRTRENYFIFNHKIPFGVDWFPMIEHSLLQRLISGLKNWKDDSNVIIKEGYALKSGAVNRSWKRRYVKLMHSPDRGYELYYYLSSELATREALLFGYTDVGMLSIGSVSLSDVHAVKPDEEEQVIELDDTKANRVWKFKFGEEFDADGLLVFRDWVRILLGTHKKLDPQDIRQTFSGERASNATVEMVSASKFRLNARYILGQMLETEKLNQVFNAYREEVVDNDSENLRFRGSEARNPMLKEASEGGAREIELARLRKVKVKTYVRPRTRLFLPRRSGA